MTCTDSITVAASNVADVIAPFSNYGECVNIIAPVSAHDCYHNCKIVSVADCFLIVGSGYYNFSIAA